MRSLRTLSRAWQPLRRLAVLSVLAALIAMGGSSSWASGSERAPSKVAGTYISQYAGVLGAVSTDGDQFIAYICNGNPDNPLTFAEWFHGTVTGAHIVLTNADGANLNLFLHPWVADGRVTLKNGKQYYFEAPPVLGQGDPAKLVRSLQTINGVQYLAGWIVPPQAGDDQGTGSGAYSSAKLAAEPPPHNWCWWDCVGGAIRNESTEALIKPGPLSPADIRRRRVNVPGIGFFNFTICNRGQCS